MKNIKIMGFIGWLAAAFLFVPSTGYSQTEKSQKGGTTLQEIRVQTNAKCEMCKSRIETAVKAVKGVKSASLDMKNSVLTVKFSPEKTNADSIYKAITQAGYGADDAPPDAAARAKLPKCCK